MSPSVMAIRDQTGALVFFSDARRCDSISADQASAEARSTPGDLNPPNPRSPGVSAVPGEGGA